MRSTTGQPASAYAGAMAHQLVIVVTILLLSACNSTPAATSVADGAVTRNRTGVPADATPRGSPSSTATDPGPTTAPAPLVPSEGFARGDVVFTDGTREVATPVLVADDPGLRATGLMGRTSLPVDAGMLFVFEAATQGAFWMKDTLLPLSIAFVAQDGTVQQVMEMDPCAADPCTRYVPDEPYRYAVEANRGYFDARGIAPGWTLEIDGRRGGAR